MEAAVVPRTSVITMTPKNPWGICACRPEYGGDGGLAVVDKEDFIRVRTFWDSSVGG